LIRSRTAWWGGQHVRSASIKPGRSVTGRRRSPGRRIAVPLVGFSGSVPQACQSIQDEIDRVQSDLNDLQFELKHAAPEDKPAIRKKIRDDNKQLVTLRNQLAECIGSQPTV